MLWDIRLSSICGSTRFPLQQKQMVGQTDSKAEVINNSSAFWKAFIYLFIFPRKPHLLGWALTLLMVLLSSSIHPPSWDYTLTLSNVQEYRA